VVRDPAGEPAAIRRRERLRSHRLIEEFMLLANEAVARLLTRRGVPIIYRVHEMPSDESMQELADLLLQMGYRLPATDRTRALRAVLRQARGAPEGGLVTGMVLRAMRKAIYSERNLGHFALASGDYTHFTSPIRRYPDLTVHRALRAAWEETPRGGGDGPEPWDRGETPRRAAPAGPRRARPARPGEDSVPWRRRRIEARELADVAAHVTRREIAGDQVERASFAEAAAIYMRSHLGAEFEGIVGGFGRAGMFVQLAEVPVEGLVPFSSLGRERFTHP
jgi:ribonuclease R